MWIIVGSAIADHVAESTANSPERNSYCYRIPSEKLARVDEIDGFLASHFVKSL
jgi:hypothetical protein